MHCFNGVGINCRGGTPTSNLVRLHIRNREGFYNIVSNLFPQNPTRISKVFLLLIFLGADHFWQRRWRREQEQFLQNHLARRRNERRKIVRIRADDRNRSLTCI